MPLKWILLTFSIGLPTAIAGLAGLHPGVMAIFSFSGAACFAAGVIAMGPFGE